MKKLFSIRKERNKTPGIPEAERISLIEKACKQVSRGVFFSTIIIITSFLPVFLLTGQEGKLFHPLAFTKTFIMIVDALLVITLAPVLISFFMKGRFRPETKKSSKQIFGKNLRTGNPYLYQVAKDNYCRQHRCACSEHPFDHEFRS